MEVFQTNTALQKESYPGKIINIKEDEKQVIFQTENNALLCVKIINDDIIRFRYGTYPHFYNDFSYGIDTKYKTAPECVKKTKGKLYYRIETATLKIEIELATLKIRIKNLAGKLINQDEKGFHWEENFKHGGNLVFMSKEVQGGEHYFGMGDKPMHLNLRGKRIVNWGSDEYGFETFKDPLYKSIPFYIGLHNGLSYGIFFDNSFKSHFDFASERRTATSFWAEGGEMNYYFINGPEMKQVAERYAMLTGRPDMPPLWAFGYHQSKWSYQPESNVREVCKKMRDLKIPCDGIYFDIDYMDGFRCFTWDKQKFPNPKKLIADLAADGYKSIAIIDPGIKVDPEYEIFKEGLENDYFCRRADGPYMKGKVWPGECYFPDYTNPKVRKWWSGLFKNLIQEDGIRGIWNDMNEPAIFEVESKTFPDDVRHDYDGHPCSHRKAHNVYGMQMARATLRGVRKFLKPKRPLVITRSAYSGTQRYALAWTGDNLARWDHIWVANVQCQRMSISGFSFIGSDIGGFIDQPSSELLIRWMQLGIFHPFCRNHSSGDHGNQEPWVFGEHATDIIRKFVELRYKLLPYLYSTFYQYVKFGTPVLRPISFEDQGNENILFREDEFLHGDHLLICPIQEQNAKGRYLYLPKGSWVHYWSDKVYEGGDEVWIDAPLDEVPLFIRSGAVIPHFPVMQYVGEKKVQTLDLHVYYSDTEVKSMMYEDEGDGYEYVDGMYTITDFTVNGETDKMTISQRRKGHYEPSYETCKIILHSLPFDKATIRYNGTVLELEKNEHNTIEFELALHFLELKIEKRD